MSLCCFAQNKQTGIDRFDLVNRHAIILNAADTLGSLSVGNGEFAFTVDVSGLQTFPDAYGNGVPLGTLSQWGWHRNPASSKYSLNDVNVMYASCDGSESPYPIQHRDGYQRIAADALRSNPHRLHLGLVGLKLRLSNGNEVSLSDLKAIKQKLDLWKGQIETSYEIEGTPVTVTLYAHQQKDQIAARIDSDLIRQKRLTVRFRFAYGKECHTCPGYDFDNGDLHKSFLTRSANNATITRTLDSTLYYVNINFSNGTIEETRKHEFELIPDGNALEFTALFSTTKEFGGPFSATEKNSITTWKEFWSQGGAVDFSACTDERAKELERRVILSQYLTKIQCAGSLPPQETGLTMNSWFGKFHMEMYWWHGAHFPLWGRSALLEKSMTWYQQALNKAIHTAKLQGFQGARWQKMTDPFGNESPSSVGAFIIWQQPHPIYLAELLYRSNPTQEVLKKYRHIVYATADFMTSFLKEKDGILHLCHPLIPAQEIFRATETDDPTYELQYWHYGLSVAKQWRKRLGEHDDADWSNALEKLAPLPIKDGLYLPNGTTPAAYVDHKFRHDHPAVLGALGFVPFNPRMDTTIMLNTLNEIMDNWDWPSTWGWDYPLVAMTATRLHQPEIAVDALLMPVQKNRYLVNGHNFQDDRLRIYLPGNGGILSAISLMCAGWDGNSVSNPGFPKNGKWNVKWEGLKRMP